MALEIEHKFLMANENWRQEVSRTAFFRQGYLTSDSSSSIRVRICDDRAWLNIKSATVGTHRQEFEYEIPLADADEIINSLCRNPVIEKTRHYVNFGQHTWEIDEFDGENAGLIVAEIELSGIGEPFEKPDWIGEEVTLDVRYYNNNLALHPYNTWESH